MTDSSNKKPSPESSDIGERRKILRYIVAGGSLGTGAALVPDTWIKPVVHSVALPVHAQTSVVPFNGTGLVGAVETVQNTQPDEFDFREFVDRVRGAIISDAQAVVLPDPSLFCISIFVSNLLDNDSSATCVLNSNALGPDQGTGTLAQLLSSGIITSLGYVVVANELNLGGSGNGTVNGVPFSLTGGACDPQDGGEAPTM